MLLSSCAARSGNVQPKAGPEQTSEDAGSTPTRAALPIDEPASQHASAGATDLAWEQRERQTRIDAHLKRLASPNRARRRIAIKGLLKLNDCGEEWCEPTKEVKDAIRNVAVNDEDIFVRVDAAHALKRMRAPVNRPLLEDMATRLQQVVFAYDRYGQQVRSGAIQAIALLGAEVKPARILAVLALTLREDPSKTVRLGAVRGFRELGQLAAVALPELKRTAGELSKSEGEGDQEVREALMEAIAHIEEQSKQG